MFPNHSYQTHNSSSGIWAKILLVLNLLSLLGLLLAYLSYHTSPAQLLLPVFFGISYPVWFILNFLFIFLWLFRKKWWFILSLIAVVAGWSHVGSIYQSGDTNTEDAEGLDLMTYNVKFFDVYNWRQDSSSNTHNKIYRFLEEQSNDIICFQEFYNEDTPDFAVMDTLLAIQPAKNYHIDYFQTRRKDYHWGLATFSKYPIVNRNRYQFSNSLGNYCIYSDIIYRGDTIRVFNVHLESWHFEKEDYRFLSELKDTIPAKSQVGEGLKNVYWKMKSSFLKKAIQVDELKELIAQSPYPSIACGDFNSTPVSYVYNQMSSMLDDAFREKGRHFGITYNGMLPMARIDYVFYDANNFNVQSFKTFKKDYSDHFPVSVTLNFERKN